MRRLGTRDFNDHPDVFDRYQTRQSSTEQHRAAPNSTEQPRTAPNSTEQHRASIEQHRTYNNNNEIGNVGHWKEFGKGKILFVWKKRNNRTYFRVHQSYGGSKDKGKERMATKWRKGWINTSNRVHQEIHRKQGKTMKEIDIVKRASHINNECLIVLAGNSKVGSEKDSKIQRFKQQRERLNKRKYNISPRKCCIRLTGALVSSAL